MNIRYLALILLSTLMIGCEDMNELPTTPDGSVAFSNYAVEVDGALIDVVVMSNENVSLSEKPEWITQQEASVSGNNHMFTFQIKANFNLSDRKGEIKFNTAGKECAVTVSQKAYPAYEPSTSMVGLEEVIEKTELESLGDYMHGSKPYMLKGRSSSSRTTAPFYRTWDGLFAGDVFYSEFVQVGSVPANYWPVVLDLYLPESADIFNHIIYYQNSNVLGAWGGVELWVSKTTSTEDEVKNRVMTNFQKVGEMDCGGAESWANNRKVIIPADKDVTGVRTVRIVVNSAATNGTTICAGALELEAFSQKPLNFNVNDLFANNSCTVLKEGITSTDIAGYEYPLFRNVAHYLNLGLYPQKRILNIMKATSSTIPTSIQSVVGTPLVVMAEGEESNLVEVRIISPDDQSVLNSYMLNKGANKLNDCKIGNIEISYSGSTPVTLNFLNGDLKE